MKNRLFTLQAVLDALGDGIVVVDEGGQIVAVNAALTDLLGHAPAELCGKSLDCLIPARYRPSHGRHLQRFVVAGAARLIGRRPVLRALARDGSERPVTIMVSSLDVDDERFTLAALRDASVFDLQLERAVRHSQTDALTGIPNRTRLIERLRERVEQPQPFGLLFLDLTGFKRFNDAYGHLIGDEVLRVVAQRLSAAVRGGDLAVRWAGDEFVVVLEDVDHPATLDERASAVAHHLAQPFGLGTMQATIGVNIGGALYPRDATQMEALIEAADRAMYIAKARGLGYVAASDLR
jgi:diguanylate cyclase (GGDEF)-like protein/PAS domain S-box-containing protein